MVPCAHNYNKSWCRFCSPGSYCAHGQFLPHCIPCTTLVPVPPALPAPPRPPRLPLTTRTHCPSRGWRGRPIMDPLAPPTELPADLSSNWRATVAQPTKQAATARPAKKAAAKKKAAPAKKQAAKKAAGRKRCPHGCLHRPKCRVCSPQNFCEHGRRKCRCVDCGTGLCEHGKRKDLCVTCSGVRDRRKR